MDSWVRGAPPGTKFNRTKSGWFDGGTFECFFNDILLPIIKKQEGAHAMIGIFYPPISVKVLWESVKGTMLSSYAFNQILHTLHSP